MLAEINALAEDMKAQGSRTLGEHLADLQDGDSRTRIRGRHTHRQMFEEEFEAVWEVQRKYHPALLTDQLKYGTEGKQTYPCPPKRMGKGDRLTKFGIHGLIFFQRPMYWPASVVGRCELEPSESRPRADRLAKRFRLLQEVNNLRLLDPNTAQERPLTAEQRRELLDYLARSKERKFTEIRKKLGLLDTQRFNLERGERDKLLGMPTDCLLAKKDFFGKRWWERPEEERTEMVRLLLDDHVTDENITQCLAGKWNLSPEAAEQVLDTDLGKGYARYSRKALAKLVPYMEEGLPLTAPGGERCVLREAGYLQPHERAVGQKDLLDEPPDVANPLVRQALHEVRKVVNAVVREYGKPARIHVELMRQVKGPAEQRQRLLKDNRERERERDRAAECIRDLGFRVTGEAITRYLLWEQQGETCVYSGRSITPLHLFGGDVDVDHILPYGRSLDNSQMNRVVCFRSENAAKGDRTPHEWLAASDPEKFSHVLQRADGLPYPKARRFGQKSVELTDFFARQFVDTAYITTQVREYLERLGYDFHNFVCTKGRHTAELRRHWGLNTVLRHDDLDLKNRKDHRHHAVNAIVISLTSRSRLQQLAKLYKQGGIERTGEVLPDPWPHFRADVERAINAVNVSHRVERSVHGALHEETIYGPTAKPGRTCRRRSGPGRRSGWRSRGLSYAGKRLLN